MKQPAILEVDDVSKVYASENNDSRLALDSVSLDVHRGEFISIIGPSGCGKTTLLKICAGLLKPSSGSISFEQNPGTPPPKRMGIVFQTAALLPWRNVWDNIMLPAIIQGADRATVKDRAGKLLAMLNLTGTEKKYPWELSGGMQQRVSIARSLVLEPEIIFMDEPFGALDAMTREKLNIDVQEIHARTGATVLFVTHNITEAVFLSDRIVAMTAGPGRIGEVIDVDLPRPRTEDHYAHPDFRHLEQTVRSVFNAAAVS